MDSIETTEIFIEWDGPYSYKDVIEKVDKKDFSVKPTDFGLYQVYGYSPLYGKNVLIYIGKTEQPFSDRLKGRGVIEYNQDAKNIQIYLGRIFYDDNTKNLNLSSDISKAESLLIHYHKPANNSANINSLKYANENIRVINVGNYRSLQLEVSTKAFTKEMVIYEMLDNIGKELNIKKALYYTNDEGYGFWLNEEKKIRIGVEYDLWYGDIILVLIASSQIDDTFKKYKIKEFYKPIYGNKEEVLKKILKYQKK